MSKLYSFVRSYSLYCLAFISFLSVAFSTEKIQGPDGNAVYHIQVFNEKGVDYKLMTTNFVVYSSHYDFSTGWSKAKKLYSFPFEGKVIVDLTMKKGETGNTRHCYTLQNDGTVSEFAYDITEDKFQNNPVIEKPLSEMANYDSKKIIVGTSLHLSGSGRLFTNKRDGKGWLRDSLGLIGCSSFCLDKDDNLFVAYNGIYIKNNTSDSFQLVKSIATNTYYNLIYCSNDNIIYTFDQKGNLFSTSDAGKSWTEETGLNNLYVYNFFKTGSNYYAVSYNNSNYVLLRKEPFGNWERIDTNIRRSTGIDIKYFNDIGGLFTLEVATTQGMLSSDDAGNTWQVKNSGIEAENITGGFFLNNGKMIANTALGIFRRKLNNSDWAKIYPKTGNFLYYPFLFRDGNDNLYLAETNSKGEYHIYTSSDEGNSWNIDPQDLSKLAKYTERTFDYYADKKGGQYITISNMDTNVQFTIFSKTPSTSWAVDTTGFNLTGLPYYASIVSQIGEDKNYIYISGRYYTKNDITYKNFLYKRAINGSVWILDTVGLNSGYIYNFLSDKNGEIQGAGYNYSGKTDIKKYNAGQWKSINKLPPVSNYNITAMGFDSSNTLFTSFNISNVYNFKESLFATPDEGNTWLKGDLGTNITNALATWKDSTYAFTNRGIYLITTKPAKFPKMTVSSDTIDFGQVPTGRRMGKVLKITNNGEDTLFVQGYTYEDNFYTKEQNLIILPGETKDFTFIFKPLYLGKDSLKFSLSTNDYAKYIFLKGEGILTDSSAKYILSKDTIDYGIVQTGTYKDSVITIHNTGFDTLFVYNVDSKANGFNSQSQSFTVPPGGEYKNVIRFSPNGNGLNSGCIVFQSNIMPDSIFVKGTGWTKPKPKLQAKFTTINFGTVVVGTVRDTFLLISNPTQDTIQINDLISSNSCFTMTPKKMKMQPGYNIVFYPSFAPTEIKSYSEFFEIIANDLPDTIFVIGAAIKSTGIIDNNSENILQISPNPVTDFLEISVGTNDIRSEQNIEIFSVLGEKILKINPNSQYSNPNTPLRIDVSSLPQGIYFVKVGDNVGKFVKI